MVSTSARRQPSRQSPVALYLQAAARERPCSVEGLRALAADLESYASFQTAAIVRDLAVEVEEGLTAPVAADGGRDLRTAFQWQAS